MNFKVARYKEETRSVPLWVGSFAEEWPMREEVSKSNKKGSLIQCQAIKWPFTD